MVTEMITLKMESGFLKEVDLVVKNDNYKNRTEFIRAALRDKIEESELRSAMKSIAHLKGASNKKISKKEFDEVRNKVFDELDKKIK